MADIEFKSGTNVDSAYVDGHKVRLIAIPTGSLQLPISATSDSGYVVDGNGKKHRVLLATFLAQTPEYKDSATADSAYVTIDGKKHKVTLTATLSDSLELPDSANADQGYATGSDSKKHRVTLVATPTGSLELSDSETYDYGYIVDGNGKKHKVKLLANIAGGEQYIEVIVKGVAPLTLTDAIADSLIYFKAYGDCENRNVPEGYQELEYIEGNNNAQYINTGIVPTSSMSMYFKGQFASVVVDTEMSMLLGARDTSGQYGLFLNANKTSIGLDFFQVNSRWTENNTRTNGDVVEFSVNNALAEIKVNGTSLGTHQFTPDDTTQYPLFLNALNNVGVPFSNVSSNINRIYRFIIDGICDMRPARRLSDGVLGMYDTIRKRFFTNAGTGSFVAGRDISAEPLPTGYTRLAYIESDGTQYIDTGLKVDQDTEIEMVFQRTQLSNYFLYGITTSGNVDCCSAYVTGTDTAHYWRFDDEYVNMQDVGGIINTAWHRTIQNKNGVKLDSNTVLAYTSIGTFETTANLPVFCRYVSATSEYAGFAYIRISSFVMRKNGTDVLNLVPAKRNSDSAIGMYDTVSNTFFANAGTGTFAYAEYPTPTAPQDIWCNNGAIKAIRPIKYLESTGTQYIDTGVVPNQDTRVELDGQMISTTAAAFFGVRTDATTDVYAIQRHSSGKIAMGYNDLFGLTDVDADTNRHVWYKNKNLQYIDGNLAFTANYSNFTAMGTAILFGFNNNGSKASSVSLRVYSCKIWNSDTLIRDFIPALDSNNIPCMFDKVEGKCYYNAGTGQFIAGYLPAEYEELEYIQGYCSDSSDSTIKAAYIDTGIILPANANFYLKSQLASSPTTNSYLMCGTRTEAYAGSEIYVGSTNTVIDWYGSTQTDRLTINDGGSAGDMYEIYGNNKTLTVFKNGSNIGSKTFDSPTTPTLTFWLNSRNTNNQVTSQTAPTLGRIYRFTVAGVCDMIPARKRSNGHIGMYDLVRRQFFENAGEGQFTFGKLPILPETYTRLEYLESTGTQYIDTGVVPNQDTSVELDGSIDGYGIFFGVRTTTTEGVSTIQGLSSGTWAMGYNNSSVAFGTKDSNRHVWFKNKNLQYMDGELKYNYTYANFTAMGNAYLFAYNNNGAVGYVINGRVRVYSCKIWATADSMLVRYMIPAKRNSDGVVGMYDIMNDVFLTNQGTGTFAYGAEIPDSRESYYYVDGVVEKVGTRSAGNKNLFNGVFEQGGLYQGNLVVADTRIRTPEYLTFPAGTYTISCASAYEVWIEKNDTSSVNWYSSYTFTAASTDKFKIAVRSKTDPSTTVIRPNDPVNVQVEAGSTATAYEPYLDGGKATCENLLGIGDTKDVQEILTGTVTRKFAVVVLDGSEVWVDLNNQHQMYQTPAPNTVQPSGPADIVSTHFVSSTEPMSSMPNHSAKFAGAGAFPDCGLLMFKETDFSGVSQWTAWLRQQYDNGTPVVVVYPLSADETESVAGQTLTVSAGNNTAEIVQASIDGLELEVKYTKTVA